MNQAHTANQETCSICGLNVDASRTTFSPTGGTLCRPCANHGEILASGQRARENAAEAHGRIGPFVGKGANAAVDEVARGLMGIETDNVTAMEAASVAGATTFTCTCDASFDVAQGTKCYDRRIRCGTCGPPFQAQVEEATQRAAAEAAKKERIKNVLFAIALIAAIAYLVFN